MPIFTAIAAGATAIATAVGFSAATAAAIGSVAAFAARTLLTIGISKLVANRAAKKAAGASDVGARIQLPPATDNKLPVIYGSAFIAGVITDAKLSTDQKTMYYVVSFAEVTDTTVGSSYSFGDIYYDSKKVTFGTGGDAAKVISLTTNSSGTPEVDTKVDGNLFIYLFNNGSNSGINTGGQTAIQILSDSDIPADLRWNSALYTSGGESPTMSNTAFAIIKVKYNQDAGTTNLGALQVQLENSLSQPGSVIKDYLLNERYGCAIPLSRIDTASLTALDAYAAETIEYIPVGGGTATQQRYRIDGPLNTGNDCLSNLQQLVDACDSWLQYSELTGKWKVVINRSYTDYTTLANLYSVNDDNLISGVEVNPLDLNSIYNEMEVQYPNKYIKDQTDFQIVSLFSSFPSLLSPNEPINRLVIQYPQVNNAVQAKYLGLRRLLQNREDLVVTFSTDYSGIQVEAGDVIKVTLSQYGWTDKLFRVNNVAEEKYGDGSLGARITAFEYNDSVYADNSIEDFVPEFNTGLADPNNIGTPACPIVTVDLANTIATMNVQATVPSPGIVLYMDFNYGNSSNVQEHLLYSTVSGNGQPLLANSNVSISVTDLPTGNYWWSVTAKNNSVGSKSNSCPGISQAINWPGPTVTTAEEDIQPNANSTGNVVTVADTGNMCIGGEVLLVSGNGTLASNTRIVDITGNTTFVVNNDPSVPLSDATIKVECGGIKGTNIRSNTITNNNLADATIQGNKVAANTISSNNMTTTGVTPGVYPSMSNITIDAAGRISYAESSTGSWTIQEGNTGTPQSVTQLVITSGAFLTSGANVGNVLMEISTGNVGSRAGTISISPGEPFGNAFNLLQDWNSPVDIPGGLMRDGSGNVVSYTLSLPSDYNPWWNGTSSTANYFLANSNPSNPFNNPIGAGWQKINLDDGFLTKGLMGWVAITNAELNGSIPEYPDIDINQTLIFGQSQAYVLSDVDTDLWYAPCATRILPNNTDASQLIRYDTVGIIPLRANIPTLVTIPLQWFSGNVAISDVRSRGIGAGYNLKAQGMALRVPDSTATVSVLNGYTITWYSSKLTALI